MPPITQMPDGEAILVLLKCMMGIWIPRHQICANRYPWIQRAVAWGDLGEIFARKDEQEKAVACFLIAHGISGEDYIKYLKSLLTDQNEGVQRASFTALSKIGAAPAVPTDQNE